MKFSMVAAALATYVFAMPLASQARDLTVGLSASTMSMDPQFYVVDPNSAMARNIFDGLVNQDISGLKKPNEQKCAIAGHSALAQQVVQPRHVECASFADADRGGKCRGLEAQSICRNDGRLRS